MGVHDGQVIFEGEGLIWVDDMECCALANFFDTPGQTMFITAFPFIFPCLTRGRVSASFSKGKVSIWALIFISPAILKNSLPSSLDMWAKDFIDRPIHGKCFHMCFY